MRKVTRKIFGIMIFLMMSLINFSFADAASANIPVVTQGLTPIKYNGTSYVTTTHIDRDWYDYENGVWANAKTNNDKIYVWIPRFTYKISGGNIDIKWSDGKIDDTDDGYLTHPAFYFGEYLGGDTSDFGNFIERTGKRNELTGFWIQKDLFSTNVTNVSDAINNSIKMTSDTAYGLPQSGTYTHMTKASEWGAVAYLTQAKGKLTGNRTTTNYTGMNIGTVTEYVAAIKGNPNTSINLSDSNYKKYRDTLDGSLSDYYGFALTETASLAKDSGSISSNTFLVRGGSMGLFGYTSSTGVDSGRGYRTSISIISEELTDTVAFFDTETSVVAGDYLILGVDFYVNNDWKFPENPANFFIESSNARNKKVVDIECIYEGGVRWHQKDLNAEVIKMVKKDMSVVDDDALSKDEVYEEGKYTLVVRVGGKNGDTPVFMPMDNMDAKIVVNELNLKSSSGDLIKIGNIPNNKVRLNIFGESGSNAIDKVVLKTAPTKLDYELEEELNLSGGVIVPYLGTLAGEEISITMKNIHPDDRNLTNIPGQHLVRLKYNEYDVIQDEVKFTINVSNTRQLTVSDEIIIGSDTVNSHLIEGPGKYKRANTDVTENLKAYEFLNGHMFSGWTSNSTYVKAQDNNYSSTFIVPKKTTTIDKDVVTITAHYVAPSKLMIEDVKTEFIVNEDFSLGNGKIYVVYQKDGQEVKKIITLGTAGVTVKLKNGDTEFGLDNLQLGDYTVTIGYAGKEVIYPIEVVNPKYNLNVYTESTEYGMVSVEIKKQNGVVRETVSLDKDTGHLYRAVSCGNTVTLKATPETDYSLSKWVVYGPEGLVAEEDLTKSEISFVMPKNDVRVDAEFLKACTLTFKVKEGQDDYGYLEGELEQKVLTGNSATPVKAVAEPNYFFKYWLADEEIVSTEEELLISYVDGDKEYIAEFDNIWTVKFYNDSELFKEIKVKNGESGHISDIPTKYGYVFTGWDKNLSVVTSNMEVYAEYVPRINIVVNKNAEVGKIDAQITGTMIQEGTLQYLISRSPNNPEIFTTYELDDVFTGFDGNWYNLDNTYRSEAIGGSQDSSSLLTISSKNETEVIKFDYILSASEDSQLGIIINGVKVVSPSTEISTGWNSFEGEVPVIDGVIKLGISYSQGEIYEVTDFAAIRNLAITRKWTVITNDYHLFIPAEFGDNYIHVKGTGSDDLEVYTKVSEYIKGN